MKSQKSYTNELCCGKAIYFTKILKCKQTRGTKQINQTDMLLCEIGHGKQLDIDLAFQSE